MNSSDSLWLSLEQQAHWRSLLRGTQLLLDTLDRDLGKAADLGLNEYEVLVRLSEAPDRNMRMSALADAVVHSRSRLTHTISRMEKKGLVLRHPADGDRRGVQCQLTDEGYAVLEAAAPYHVRSVRDRLVDVLTEEQLEVLGESFATITRAIDASNR